MTHLPTAHRCHRLIEDFKECAFCGAVADGGYEFEVTLGIGIQYHKIRERIGLERDDVFDFLFLRLVQIVDECTGSRDSSREVFTPKSVERNCLEMFQEFRAGGIRFKSPIG